MTLQSADVHQLLHRILGEEAQLLAELLVLLRDEAAILSSNDIDGISRIGSTRQRCIGALTALDAERASACRMLSFGQGAGAYNQLIKWCDQDGALDAKWRSNLALARQCQQLNDTNGAVVTAKLSRVQQLLMAVRGTPAPSVYNARGSRYGQLGARDLGCA
jgi:flagellar biosynthesis/type III secretory pathway chaperone